MQKKDEEPAAPNGEAVSAREFSRNYKKFLKNNKLPITLTIYRKPVMKVAFA